MSENINTMDKLKLVLINMLMLIRLIFEHLRFHKVTHYLVKS